MPNDSMKDNNEKIEAIKRIYGEFLSELAKLKKEERDIIYKYIKKEEEKKIRDIRNKLLNQ